MIAVILRGVLGARPLNFIGYTAHHAGQGVADADDAWAELDTTNTAHLLLFAKIPDLIRYAGV